MKRFGGLAAVLVGLSIGCAKVAAEVEITNAQRIAYPANPKIVKYPFEMSPEQREMFLAQINKKIAIGNKYAKWSGLVSGGFASTAVYATLVAGMPVVSVVALVPAIVSLGVGSVAYMFYYLAQLYKQEAYMQQLVSEPDTLVETTVEQGLLLDDGIYCFSREFCPPCMQLKSDLPAIKEKLTKDMPIFVYMSSAPETKDVLERMGITFIFAPLIAIVHNGKIVRIIMGYHSIDVLVNDINEVIAE